jgi:nitrogen-specific signal transduction histidine kinase
MIVLLRSEANRDSISIRSGLASDLPKIMADRVQLQQVLMNLMLNGIEAIKDTSAGGELTIGSRQAADLGRRYGRGTRAKTGTANLQCIFYHQTSGHRHGIAD